MIDCAEPPLFEPEQMPRFTLSANEEQFQKLFGLLSTEEGETADTVWNLVRMLATNQKMYEDILNLHGEAQVNWQSVFVDENKFKQAYQQEIISDILESSAASTTGNPIEVTKDIYNVNKNKQGKIPEPLDPVQLKSTRDVIDKAKKASWKSRLLNEQGFAYMVEALLS